MKKSIPLFIGIIILDVLSAIITFSEIIVFSGIITYFLWFIPPLLTIFVLITFRHEKVKRITLILCLIFYLIISAWNCIAWSAKTVLTDKTIDNKYYVTYEINPGAMSHFSYQKMEYINLIDTPCLKMRLLMHSKSSRYTDAL